MPAAKDDRSHRLPLRVVKCWDGIVHVCGLSIGWISPSTCSRCGSTVVVVVVVVEMEAVILLGAGADRGLSAAAGPEALAIVL